MQNDYKKDRRNQITYVTLQAFSNFFIILANLELYSVKCVSKQKICSTLCHGYGCSKSATDKIDCVISCNISTSRERGIARPFRLPDKLSTC